MRKRDRQKFRNWKAIRAVLFSAKPKDSSEFFVNQVMARLDEVPAAQALPQARQVPFRVFVPLAAAAMLLIAILPVGGPSSEWMLGSDGMSRMAFAGDAPQSDDVLEFVMVRS